MSLRHTSTPSCSVLDARVFQSTLLAALDELRDKPDRDHPAPPGGRLTLRQR